MEQKWAWIEGSNAMRDGLLEHVSDSDLAFTPGGDSLTLGALFRQMGEVQYSYLRGLTTFEQDFAYRNTEAGLETSVSRLSAWFHELDAELRSVTEAFSDDELDRLVKRESGFEMPVEMSLDVYVQALLIFFGKATIYFRAMGKPLPPAVQEWIW
jgi:hypothetical protein